jgi:hypothetical protein
LVNIVLNGLPKTWDAFSASMNRRKEYPTFEEFCTCCAQEESRISAKEKPLKKYYDQSFTTRFKNFKNMLIEIGERVQWTRRAHLVVVLPWIFPWFPGAAINKALCP